MNSYAIQAKVSPNFISKAALLFRNDHKGVFIELLQNSRRARATVVHVAIHSVPNDSQQSYVTFEDDGEGIADFGKLLELGRIRMGRRNLRTRTSRWHGTIFSLSVRSHGPQPK